MGGHGALTLYLKGLQKGAYKSASAFAPIWSVSSLSSSSSALLFSFLLLLDVVLPEKGDADSSPALPPPLLLPHPPSSPPSNPSDCPWGQKAFSSYLSPTSSPSWSSYDALALLPSNPQKLAVKITYGLDDQFFKDGQLRPEVFEKRVQEKGLEGVEVEGKEGYDHSYYFVRSPSSPYSSPFLLFFPARDFRANISGLSQLSDRSRPSSTSTLTSTPRSCSPEHGYNRPSPSPSETLPLLFLVELATSDGHELARWFI